MNRIMAMILILTALALHFSYCEWRVVDNLNSVSSAEKEREIYFSYSRHRSVFLLARSSGDLPDAKTYGVLLPGLLLGGALAALHFMRRMEEAEAA